MQKFDVGLVTVTCSGRTARYSDVQENGGPVLDAKATLAELETPDGFRGTVGVLEWPNNKSEIKLVDFSSGPENYRRLESAGRGQILIEDGHWLVVIRALKHGDKNRFTLHNVTLDQLSELIKDDAAALLTSFSGVELGRYGDMQPKASAQVKDAVGMRSPIGQIEPLAAMYAMTRVMTVMNNFGLATVKGMD